MSKTNPVFSLKKPLFAIPNEVSYVTKTLEKAGFEAYLIGGCVRDLVLKKKPKDWDITTNATPEQIIPLFKKTFYENHFGTVGVVNEETVDETLKIIEVTPYRTESGYSDNRRPDSVEFSKNLEDDLKRRDFTINAIAYNISKGQIIDLYKGQEDLKVEIIKTVGEPLERFNEDGLRILRAVRFHAELGFTINKETEIAITKTASLLDKISKERIRDEFVKIIMSDKPMDGLIMAQKLGILKHIVPILEKTIGVEQNKSHIYDVWNHILRALQLSADKKWPLEIRLSALFHDIGKPESRRFSNESKDFTFYGHEVIGARIVKNVLEDLKFSKEIIEKVEKLVRWHMFFSDTEQITLSAVRRMIVNVGKENIWDLMNVRVTDRIGMGRPKEDPYRLRKYHAMIDEAMQDPISVGMLKIDGNDLIKMGIAPGPKIGNILHALLEKVLDNPKENTVENLTNMAKNMANLSNEELVKIGEDGKEKKEIEAKKQVKEIRKRHKV